MSNFDPLKNGQEVFVKRPLQVYANVIGPGGYAPEDGAATYYVKLQPLKQYYRWEDLEPSAKPELKPSGRLDFFDRAREITSQIARRAYELFEFRGHKHGHHDEDWFRAQSEIVRAVPVDIRETADEITVRAEVPGFSDENLEVQVAPGALCISGWRDNGTQYSDGNTVYSERETSQVFRLVELPSEVDPNQASLSLSDGILEIKLAKAAVGKAFAASAD
jgi:HSP20 family protein